MAWLQVANKKMRPIARLVGLWKFTRAFKTKMAFGKKAVKSSTGDSKKLKTESSLRFLGASHDIG